MSPGNQILSKLRVNFTFKTNFDTGKTSAVLPYNRSLNFGVEMQNRWRSAIFILTFALWATPRKC